MALSSSLMIALTPCVRCALGGLYVLVGSVTYPSPGCLYGPSCRGCLKWWETGLTYHPPPRTSRTLSIALIFRHASLVLMRPAIDIVWRWVALSSSLTVAMTPCHCSVLGGLYVQVGSLTSPSPGRTFGPSCSGCHGVDWGDGGVIYGSV